ncbi:MAG: hypothetical protein ACOC0X_00315 [Halobacteriota archaeon]
MLVGLGALAAGATGCIGDEGTTATPEPERVIEAIVFNTAEYTVDLAEGDRVIVELTHVDGHTTFANLRGPRGGADVVASVETDASETLTHTAREGGEYRVFISVGGQADVEVLVERRSQHQPEVDGR